jgi:hypothetical protein
MKNRTLQVLLLAAVAVAATAHCGKRTDTTAPPSLGPTDVVVTWTFDGKPASAAECTARGGLTVAITLSATGEPSLHQDTTAPCEKGTVTFSALDTAGLGMPFLEGALLDNKGVTVTRANVTVTPKAGTTPATLDFFPSTMAASTSGDPATTTGDPATTSGSGMGGMGGMGGMTATSAASSTATSAGSTTAAATTAGAGGADAGP